MTEARDAGEPKDETLGQALSGVLKRAVADREAHPWRYYKLDHDTMKRICDKQAAELATLRAAHDRLRAERDAVIDMLDKHTRSTPDERRTLPEVIDAILTVDDNRVQQVQALRQALESLRNECRGLLGAFRLELIESTSLTNVRVLERKVADADAALALPGEAAPRVKRLACPHGDKTCPCQDGDTCHYEGHNPMTPPGEAAPKETQP